MEEQINQLVQRATQHITQSSSLAQLQEARVALLGKKGKLTALLRGMGALSAED